MSILDRIFQRVSNNRQLEILMNDDYSPITDELQIAQRGWAYGIITRDELLDFEHEYYAGSVLQEFDVSTTIMELAAIGLIPKSTLSKILEQMIEKDVRTNVSE